MNDTGRPAWRFSWPLIILIVVALRLAAGARALLNDPDTYLHIATGRWIWLHRALPFHDPFSGSVPGADWYPHEWLAELILAGAYAFTGWGGVVLLTIACVTTATVLVARFVLRHFEPLTGMIVVITLAAMLLPHALARPHALALPLLAGWTVLLIEARDRGRGPPWPALGLMVLWANLHGGFMAGIALVAFLTVEATLDRKAAGRWLAFLAGSLLAALVSPLGVETILQPLRLSAMPTLNAHFLEWAPLDLRQFQMIEIWILALAALCVLRKGPRLTRLLLSAVLCAAAVLHQRHLDLVAMIVPAAVAASMGPGLAASVRSQPNSPIARFMALPSQQAGQRAMAASCVLLMAVGATVLVRPYPRADDAVTPTSALAAARAQGIGAGVFNDEGFGGYLIWCGIPTFIDGRIEMYGDAFLARYLAAEAGARSSLDDVLGRYDIRWALLTPESGAAKQLAARPGWRRIYADKIAVVYARAGADSAS